ncbi:LysR family transcriptional regulator [Zhihengliuella sp.]|uniref:LysR family transcriptional regulator n=1 Tax=Zhihengliuella sp. TaxID=1954483 RepID=UPI002811392F|nr:LysR family transcriptional regulator [Zhihengliuella sp.]
MEDNSLRVAYVPGVTPGKWLSRWRDRLPDVPLDAVLHDAGDPRALLDLPADDPARADVVFVRSAAGERLAGDLHHAIVLYEELPVVCAPREHEVELYDDEVPLEDLADQTFLDLADYPPEVGGARMAIEVVGTGAGLVIVPMSVARLYHRKDVVHRVVAGAEKTAVSIVWRRPSLSDPAFDDPESAESKRLRLIEEFVGVVRGRSPESSRQPSVRQRQQEEAAKAQRKRQASAPARGTGAGKAGAKSAGGRAPSKPGRGSGGKSGGKGRGRR